MAFFETRMDFAVDNRRNKKLKSKSVHSLWAFLDHSTVACKVMIHDFGLNKLSIKSDYVVKLGSMKAMGSYHMYQCVYIYINGVLDCRL